MGPSETQSTETRLYEHDHNQSATLPKRMIARTTTAGFAIPPPSQCGEGSGRSTGEFGLCQGPSRLDANATPIEAAPMFQCLPGSHPPA